MPFKIYFYFLIFSLISGSYTASSKSKESIQKSHQPEPTLEEFVEKIDHFRLIMPEPELQLDFPREDFDFLVAYKKVYGYD